MKYYLITLVFRLVDVYSFMLVVYALLSWFPGAYQSRLGQVLATVVEPILSPFRRLRLQFFGIDFSILALLLTIRYLTPLLVRLIIFI